MSRSLWLLLSALFLPACQHQALSIERNPSSFVFEEGKQSLFLPEKDCESVHGLSECLQAKELAQTWREEEPIEGERIRLFVTGDTGKRTEHPHRSHPDAHLVRKVGAAVCGKTCASALLLGDNLYTWGIKNEDDTRFLERFTQMYLGPKGRGDFVSSIYFIQGNHDWNPLFPARDRAQNLHRDILYRLGKRVHGAAHFWHAQLGPLRVVTLDSNYLVRNCRPRWQKGARRPGAGRLPLRKDRAQAWRGHEIECPKSETPGASSLGLQELVRVVGSEGADSTVVVGHHPWFGNGLHGTAGWYRDVSCRSGSRGARAEGAAALCRDLFPGEAYRIALENVVRPRAALYLSGHDHVIQAHHDVRHPGSLAIVVGSGSKVSPAGPRTRQGDSYHQRHMVLQAHCHLGFAIVEHSGTGLSVQLYSFLGSGSEACLRESRGRARVHSRGQRVELTDPLNDLELRCRRWSLRSGRWLPEAQCSDASTGF